MLKMNFDRRQICFDYITKKPAAYKKAYNVHAGKEEVYKVVEEELLALLWKSKKIGGSRLVTGTVPVQLMEWLP